MRTIEGAFAFLQQHLHWPKLDPQGN